MSNYLNNLPLATLATPTDLVYLEQGLPLIGKKAPLSLIQPITFRVNAQTGLNYNAALSDYFNTIITMTNAGVNAVTILRQTSLAWPIGAVLIARQEGTGATSFQAGAGVTLKNASSNSCRTQNSLIHAIQETLDVWYVGGDVL
jgi:hypothetical protein